MTQIQGCINRSSLPAGLGARGVSSEHVENMENAEKMENMEMFSGSPLMCSPVLQLRCAPVIGELCSSSRRTVLQLRCSPVLQLVCALVLGEPCSN